jgi:Zn-dependent protease with chaperone function
MMLRGVPTSWASASASLPATATAAAGAEAGAGPTVRRWSSAELGLRALLAVLVLVLFYVFSLGVVAVLLLVTWLQVQLFRSGGGALGILVFLPPLGALAILLAIWPRFHTWRDPGRGLTRQRAPELFETLQQVARATRQPMPRRVYLFDEVNAFVANRGIFMGRAMGLGLPLFELLTVGELRAVIAHELGHYASRAGGLSTFVYRAVRTFGRATAAAGTVPGLNVAFELWAEAFLRLAMPISRQQELRADELACRATGIETTISALTKISKHNPWGDIANPVAGWEQDLHETHPPLRDRIALARSLQVQAVLPADDRPARVLLETLLAGRTPAG